MEDQQSNPTEPEQTGIEMTSPEQPTKQVGSFPESAVRPSTSSQRSTRELVGQQVSGYIPPTQDATPDSVIKSGINRSPSFPESAVRPSTSIRRSTGERVGQQVSGYIPSTQDDARHGIVISRETHRSAASASEQSTAQSPQPSGRRPLNVQDTELTREEIKFLMRLELRNLSDIGLRLYRDDLDTEIVSDDETTDDESYSISDESTKVDEAGSYLKNDSTSEPSSLEQRVPEPKLQDFPRPIQAFDPSSIRESNAGALQRRAIPGDITSEKSSLRQRKRAQKRRYKSKLGPEDYHFPPGSEIDFCRLLLVILLMSSLSLGFFVLFLGLIYFGIPK